MNGGQTNDWIIKSVVKIYGSHQPEFVWIYLSIIGRTVDPKSALTLVDLWCVDVDASFGYHLTQNDGVVGSHALLASSYSNNTDARQCRYIPFPCRIFKKPRSLLSNSDGVTQGPVMGQSRGEEQRFACRHLHGTRSMVIFIITKRGWITDLTFVSVRPDDYGFNLWPSVRSTITSTTGIRTSNAVLSCQIFDESWEGWAGLIRIRSSPYITTFIIRPLMAYY